MLTSSFSFSEERKKSYDPDTGNHDGVGTN
jgi:hypothetical protein